MATNSVTVESCRICLITKYSDGVSFDDHGRKWLKMYEFCFDLKLSNKDEPRKLCGGCVKKMKEFSHFKNQAQKSDRLWKTIVDIKPGLEECKIDSKPDPINIKDEVIDIDSSDEEAHNPTVDIKPLVKKDVDICMVENSTEIPDCEDENTKENYIDENENTENYIDDDDDEYSNKDSKTPKVYTCGKSYYYYKGEKFYKCYQKHVKRNNCKLQDTCKQDNCKSQDKKPSEFSCGLCDMQTLDHEVLKRHLVEHSEKDDLSCKFCEYNGRDFADMVTHRYVHLPKVGFLKCHACDKRCTRSLSLQFHYRKVHLKKEKPGWCSVCGEEFGVYKTLRNHERLHKGSNFTCDHCGRKFLFRNSIIEHMRYHYGIKPYVCDLCGKRFFRSNNLQSHKSTVHDGKSVTCKHCGKVYKNQISLNHHLNMLTKEKLFQCHVCSKRFYHECDVKDHMKWHEDNRPFKCDLCGNAYKVKSQLKIHIRKHTGDKPYKCTLCNSAFATLASFKRHGAVHTGIRRLKCRFCEKTFNNKKQLLAHRVKVHNIMEFSLPKKEAES